jgi:dTMP kinase
MTLNFNAKQVYVPMDGEDMRQGSGKLIAIDGIDQSGKRTQTQMLARKVQAFGYHISIWNFPDYATPLGRQLKIYLTRRRRFDFHTVHLLYAANKWERAASIAREINLGRVVIINRYTPSNLAYGIAHGLSLNWLESLEEELPKADLVLILDVSPKASFKRKNQLRDVHEEDLKYLGKVRRVYLRLAMKYKWKVINGDRDPRAVSLELWRHALPILRK